MNWLSKKRIASISLLNVNFSGFFISELNNLDPKYKANKDYEKKNYEL